MVEFSMPVLLKKGPLEIGNPRRSMMRTRRRETWQVETQQTGTRQVRMRAVRSQQVKPRAERIRMKNPLPPLRSGRSRQGR
jgi:hypothetical protein